MKMIIPIVVIFVSNIYSFEVNTHQAITRCAIQESASLCNTHGAKNLNLFVLRSGILTQTYKNEIFERYNNTYLNYANVGEGFTNYDINVSDTYLGLIEAGSVLEDSVYHNAKLALPTGAGDGRFNNHYYAAQAETRATCMHSILRLANLADSAQMQTPRALCVGYKTRTDNITWALKDGVNLGEGRVNDYGIHDAFDYFANSFVGSADEMRKNQAKLFVTLGFLSSSFPLSRVGMHIGGYRC